MSLSADSVRLVLAGKTTLLQIMAGKYLVNQDAVRVLGRPAFHDLVNAPSRHPNPFLLPSPCLHGSLHAPHLSLLHYHPSGAQPRS